MFKGSWKYLGKVSLHCFNIFLFVKWWNQNDENICHELDTFNKKQAWHEVYAPNMGQACHKVVAYYQAHHELQMRLAKDKDDIR